MCRLVAEYLAQSTRLGWGLCAIVAGSAPTPQPWAPQPTRRFHLRRIGATWHEERLPKPRTISLSPLVAVSFRRSTSLLCGRLCIPFGVSGRSLERRLRMALPPSSWWPSLDGWA